MSLSEREGWRTKGSFSVFIGNNELNFVDFIVSLEFFF